MKPVESAVTEITKLSDGRTVYSIKHELISDVSPKMIIWFLNNMTDIIEISGEMRQRYLIWHPRDHISMKYLRSADDGSNFQTGAILRIKEMFNGERRNKLNIKAKVEFLDESGFAHHETIAGIQVARIDYTFNEISEGTNYENQMTIGRAGKGPLSRLINRIIQPIVFPRRKGVAWLKHNVEEVGNFQFFLPQMYEQNNLD
jgi:hypothetical protein